jgi:gentisate 1,2-dioxygenase
METSALDAKREASPQMQEFYQRLHKRNAAPLWEVLADLVPPEPKTRVLPALWRYEELRPLVIESGGLITAKEAERRVIVLENPGLAGISQITQSLYAGVQLVLPGETAPTHRHTASALRFVIESQGGYTSVDGERTTMCPGDFIVTPSWTFHDHGNPGSGPVVWMDARDVRSSQGRCRRIGYRSRNRRSFRRRVVLALPWQHRATERAAADHRQS